MSVQLNNATSNKRIAKNTIFLYARMFFVLIVSLYTSRVVLNTLGVEDFGVYNVVAGFVSLFGFLNATLSSSIQRFYNYEGTKDGELGFQKVFITGIYIHTALCFLLLLLLETFGLWYVNNIMVVPDDSTIAVNLLFQFSILSMLLIVFQIPFTGAIMAHERMDFYAFVSILDVVLKLLIVLILPIIHFDKLISYGFLLLLITIINFVIYYMYTKKNFSYLKFKREWHNSLFKSLMSFSGWNLIGTFAFLLKGQGLNMLLNYFYGTIVNAARGIAFQVNTAITGFSASLFTAFRPQVVNSYASGEYSRTRSLFIIESKVCFTLLAIIMIPVSIEMNYLLKVWLGDVVPEYTLYFSILVLIDSLICSLNTPCTQVVFATGNIRLYQILSTIVNVFLLPTSWFLLKIGFDAYSVFLITIVFSIINQCTCLYALNRVFNIGIVSYITKVCLPCLLFIFIVPIIPILIHANMNEGILRLISVGVVDLFIGLVLFSLIILTKSERNYAKKIILKKYAKN